MHKKQHIKVTSDVFLWCAECYSGVSCL